MIALGRCIFVMHRYEIPLPNIIFTVVSIVVLLG